MPEPAFSEVERRIDRQLIERELDAIERRALDHDNDGCADADGYWYSLHPPTQDAVRTIREALARLLGSAHA